MAQEPGVGTRIAKERRLADAATNRMMHLLRCHENDTLIRPFKSDQPVLRLPLLIWKPSRGDRKELLIVLHCFLVLVQIIVRRCPEEVTSRIFVGIFCSHRKRLQYHGVLFVLGGRDCQAHPVLGFSGEILSAACSAVIASG